MAKATQTVDEALLAYLKSVNTQYGATLQEQDQPQLNNAASVINDLIASLNKGALPSGTTQQIVGVMQTTASILGNTDEGFTERILKGDFSTVLKTAATSYLASDVFSDAKILSYLNKVDNDVLKGALQITSPIILKTKNWLTNKATDFLANGMNWNDAKEVANTCEDAAESIVSGEAIENSTVANMSDEYGKMANEADVDEAIADGSGGDFIESDRKEDIEENRKWVADSEWKIYDPDSGDNVIEFTSYISDDFAARGDSAHFPIEEGQFKSYNKINDGKSGTVTIAKEGDNSDIQEFFNKLEEVRNDTKKFNVVTPSLVLENMTLNTWNIKRDNTTSAGHLVIVSLDLQEVRTSAIERKQVEVKNIPADNATDASDADIQNTGRANVLPLDNGGELPENNGEIKSVDEAAEKELKELSTAYKFRKSTEGEKEAQSLIKSYITHPLGYQDENGQDITPEVVYKMWEIDPESMTKYTGYANEEAWYKSTDWYKSEQEKLKKNQLKSMKETEAERSKIR